MTEKDSHAKSKNGDGHGAEHGAGHGAGHEAEHGDKHQTGGRRHHRVSHRRHKTHHRRHRRGGSAALTRLAVPASLYALKQLMEKKSSRKFVRGVDKSLGRPGTTIMRDVTKGFVGTVDAAGSVVGLRGKKSRKSRRRKSRKSRKSRRR